MISEYDHVTIKESGITGVVVDICTIDGKEIFTVESDEKGVPGGRGESDSWKLITCLESEIEKHGN